MNTFDLVPSALDRIGRKNKWKNWMEKKRKESSEQLQVRDVNYTCIMENGIVWKWTILFMNTPRRPSPATRNAPMLHAWPIGRGRMQCVIEQRVNLVYYMVHHHHECDTTTNNIECVRFFYIIVHRIHVMFSFHLIIYHYYYYLLWLKRLKDSKDCKLEQ